MKKFLIATLATLSLAAACLSASVAVAHDAFEMTIGGDIALQDAVTDAPEATDVAMSMIGFDMTADGFAEPSVIAAALPALMAVGEMGKSAEPAAINLHTVDAACSTSKAKRLATFTTPPMRL